MSVFSRRRLALGAAVLLALGVVSPAVARADHPLDSLQNQQAVRGLTPPAGFQSAPWAAVAAPTSLDWAPDGSLFVTSMDGSLYRVTPQPGGAGGVAEAVAEGLNQPLGIAIDGDRVFVAESYEQEDMTWGRVVTFAADGTGPETVVDSLPNGRHNTNDMTIGPDGLLYITNGNSTDDGIECGPAVAPGQDETCTAPDEVERQPLSGSLLRVDPAARNLTANRSMVVATGMRNAYDVAFRPGTTEAWVPTNGPDSPAADDLLYTIETAPAATAEPVDLPGRSERAPDRKKRQATTEPTPAPIPHLGFPSCLYNAHENAELGAIGSHEGHGHALEPMDNPNEDVIKQFKPCPVDTVQRPVATFGGHVSADGLAFAHGSGFGGTYGNDLYVAEWGNLWGAEDGHVAGHKIVRVNLRDDGTIVGAAHHDDGDDMHAADEGEEHSEDDHHAVSVVTEFATGGLPIDVTFGPDGAMYVADMAGLIHRIAWDAAATAPDDEGHDHGGEEEPPPAGEDPRLADPDSYATPDHPSYDYYGRTQYEATADQYFYDELFGCNVDHPYMRWLLDETQAEVRTNLPTMREAALAGFVPLGPIPNDFGYPDTYWHWINYGNSRPRFEDRFTTGATPKNERDWIVQPRELQHLLLVPAYWEGQVTDAWGATIEEPTNEQTQGDASDGWVTAGVMYASEFVGGPDLYPGCNPFHNHNIGDTDHFHMWIDHHIHPLAMNPPHLCTADGKAQPAPYGPFDPLRDTDTDWHCIHPGSEGPDGHGDHEH